MEDAVVQKLIEEALAVNKDLFLVDWSISPAKKIEVLVDGDKGLPIEEVVRISRHIENNLDRDEFDFALMVSSPGLSRPLSVPRQYIKNVGRKLKVETSEGVTTGTIISADQEKVTLEWTAREPKPIGKGKHNVVKTATFYYKDIDKAIIQLDI